MDDLISKFLASFSQWHGAALSVLKTVIAIGVFCLVAYLLTIGYIPSEISFGDTLIFLLIFLSCSVAYAVLSMVLFFFGISLTSMVYLILSVIDKYLPPHIRIGKKLPFPKISVITLLASVYLLYFTPNLFRLDWRINLYIGITASCIAFLYYPFYINQQKIKVFSRKFENLKDIIDDPEASEKLKAFANAKLKRLDTHKKDRLQLALYLILLPIIPMFFIGEIGKTFLDYTMQNTGVRIDKAVLYVKAPYANLIDLPNTTTKGLRQHQIFIFKEVKVLFQGIGKNTLISYKIKNIEKQIVIPNEYITVERTKKVDE